MDVELFLEGQARWEVDSPHHLIILHNMFQHASEEGQKEAEHMIWQGHQYGLPKPQGGCLCYPAGRASD